MIHCVEVPACIHPLAKANTVNLFEDNILVENMVATFHRSTFSLKLSQPFPERREHFVSQRSECEGMKQKGFHLTSTAMELPLRHNVSKC